MKNCIRGVNLLAECVTSSFDELLSQNLENEWKRHTLQHHRGLYVFLRIQCSCRRTLRMSLQVEEKTIPSKGILFLLPPSVKNHCSCSPRPHTMGTLFDLPCESRRSHDAWHLYNITGAKAQGQDGVGEWKRGRPYKTLNFSWLEASAGQIQPGYAPSAKRPHRVCKGLRVSGRLFTELLLKKLKEQSSPSTAFKDICTFSKAPELIEKALKQAAGQGTCGCFGCSVVGLAKKDKREHGR